MSINKISFLQQKDRDHTYCVGLKLEDLDHSEMKTEKTDLDRINFMEKGYVMGTDRKSLVINDKKEFPRPSSLAIKGLKLLPYEGKIEYDEKIELALNECSMYEGKTCYAKKNKNGQDILHELVVGAQMNTLRTINIPNFILVHRGENDCVEYEHLGECEPCKDYLLRATPQQFLSTLLQMALSSSVANRHFFLLRGSVERYPYTHYNLTYEHVLMKRREKEVFSICYPSANGNKFYITADRVATAFNYSHTYLNGYGVPSEYTEGYSNTQGSPLHDIFKFLTSFSYYYKSSKLRSLQKYLCACLRFFTRENLDVFLQKCTNSRYNMMFDNKTDTIESFVNYLSSWYIKHDPVVWADVVSSTPRFSVLDVTKDHIPEVEHGVPENVPPATIKRRYDYLMEHTSPIIRTKQ